jgi:alpha-D-xyloside xylohydrolase
MRPLFFDHPGDPASWLVEDAYLFGRDLLVAPMFEEASDRNVYLPPGTWLDYWSGAPHAGGGWHRLAPGEAPVVLLVRDGAALPRAEVAQSTDEVDWGDLELAAYCADAEAAEGAVCLPDDGAVRWVRVLRRDGELRLEDDPLEGRVDWRLAG